MPNARVGKPRERLDFSRARPRRFDEGRPSQKQRAMAETIDRAGLQVAATLARFVEEEALPRNGDRAGRLGAAWPDLCPFRARQRALLAIRDTLQRRSMPGTTTHTASPPGDAYRAFLRDISSVDEPEPFTIGRTCGRRGRAPRRPADGRAGVNARFVLNAPNARWGSLYDALYGTDAIADRPRARATIRAGRVGHRQGPGISRQARPLASGPGPISRAAILARRSAQLGAGEGAICCCATTACTSSSSSTAIPDRPRRSGRIADIVMEAALQIVDLEDSIAAVDAEDKVAAYANWLG